MSVATRVFGNTIAMYAKIIISTVVGLFLMRVVLDVLGIEDFGIYNLIAGVISILAFLQSALMNSTQRYLSFSIGRGNNSEVKMYFVSSIFIHLFIVVAIVLILELCNLFLFDGFLNIPGKRIIVAKEIYQLMIISISFTILEVPFSAMINASEDLWFLGFIQALCAILKLGVIWGFSNVKCDVLLLYTVWMVTITFFELVATIIWCIVKYKECRGINFSIKKYKYYIVNMLSFTGWNTLGSFAVASRNQGVSIVLNIFWGPSINGVFGIANQVDGQLSTFANSMTASMAPQIVKSAGHGDYKRLNKLAMFTSKLAFMLSAFFAVPLIIELRYVLNIWLKKVPDDSESYIFLILVVFLICEINPGLVRGIQAIGKIKWQQIWCSFFVVMPVPIGILLFKIGLAHYTIIYAIIVAQILSVAVTVYWSYKLYEFNIKLYMLFCLKAVGAFISVLILFVMVDHLCKNCMSDALRFISVSVLSSCLFLLIYYMICFDNEEKDNIKNLIKRIAK